MKKIVITVVIGLIIIIVLIIIFLIVRIGADGFGPGLSDYSYNVANNYMLVRSSGHEIKVVPIDGWTNEDEIIPAKVIEIDWNDRYIIAKQAGLKVESSNSNYEIPDPTKIYYWILDTNEMKRYGPYSENEFNNKLIEFKLTDLRLKDVESYRNN